MNLRSQSGMTLVELIIGLAITATVMTALVGVAFGANLVGSTWGQRTYLAETAQMLPNQLQGDAHRYLPCPASAASDLNLCLPGGQTPVITYSAGSSCPCDLVRIDHQMGSTKVVVRALAEPPSFTVTCSTAGAVDSGSIAVQLRYHGDQAAQPALHVYFRAPAGACGP